MIELHRTVIAEVIEETKKQLVPGTEAIFLTGRFGDSKLLFDAMCEEFGSKVVYNTVRINGAQVEAVVTGALMRYTGIISRTLPTRYTFGIQRVERADPKKHPDAY